MEQIKFYDELSVKLPLFNESSCSTFRIRSSTVQPKTIELFELIYNSPANIKIKWDKADELNENLHFKETYGATKHKSSFSGYIEQFILKPRIQDAVQPNYDLNNFIQGYKDKVTTSNFYTKQTKPIQNALKNIPVYTVLNGRGEIVLANSFNGTNKGEKLNLQEIFYNFCGDFDTKSKKNYNLGLFFMDRPGAEMYLTEIAKSDIDGTKTLGLSINCISLDSAYQITREYHSPNIDFRFVPKLNEVHNLINSKNSKEGFIFDKHQHQLRFRRRPISFIPGFGKLSSIITPFNQFLSTNEYYKGVPIYLVQINDTSRSIFLEKYFNFVNVFDTFSGKLTKCIGTFCGIGQNDITEGSISDINKSDRVTNYIFFEKEKAVNFCKKEGRNVTRFKGSRIVGTGSFVRKPKIYVFNFEDFIEEWEDIISANYDNKIKNGYIEKIKGFPSVDSVTQLNEVRTIFVPAEDSITDVNNFFINSEGSLPTKKIKGIKQFFDVKRRTLISFFDIIINNG